ncbi:MAG: hypothetical protein B5M53_04980 [Candidatus Cloacimonas sp. 4484_209]|nr:MAG: hypothetical protein B5M53_04980 [Candidatus Cloacimonas sp. 4484_209]
MFVIVTVFSIGGVFIESSPESAMVYIDEKLMGFTPLMIQKKPGSYKLKLLLEGYDKHEENIKIDSTKIDTVNIVLKKSIISVAVLELEGIGIGKDEARIVTERLRADIVKMGIVKVMDRSRMDAILAEQAFQLSGACSDVACLVEVGRIIAVNRMVGGSIAKVGNMFTINLMLINVETSEIEKNVVKDYSGTLEGLIINELPEIVGELFGKKVEKKLAYGNSDLYVTSAPSGAEIFIDDIPVGKKTSALVQNITGGVHKIRVETNKLYGEQSVFLERGLNKVFFQLKEKETQLRIYSVPLGAEVYVDNVNIGLTPIEMKGISMGKHRIKIFKKDFYAYETEIEIRDFKVKKLIAQLQPIGRGNIEIKGAPIGAIVELDKGLRDTLPCTFAGLLEGVHRLKVSYPGYNSCLKQVVVKTSFNTVVEINLKKKNKIVAGFFSLLYPGLGQKWLAYKKRGAFHSNLHILSVGTGIGLYYLYKVNLTEYNKYKTTYSEVTDASSIENNYNRMVEYYNNLTRIKKAFYINLGVLLLNWGISLINIK